MFSRNTATEQRSETDDGMRCDEPRRRPGRFVTVIGLIVLVAGGGLAGGCQQSDQEQRTVVEAGNGDDVSVSAASQVGVSNVIDAYWSSKPVTVHFATSDRETFSVDLPPTVNQPDILRVYIGRPVPVG